MSYEYLRLYDMWLGQCGLVMSISVQAFIISGKVNVLFMSASAIMLDSKKQAVAEYNTVTQGSERTTAL